MTDDFVLLPEAPSTAAKVADGIKTATGAVGDVIVDSERRSLRPCRPPPIRWERDDPRGNAGGPGRSGMPGHKKPGPTGA